MKINTFITLRAILICSCCISLSCLSGCGQTGPLYMPKKSSQKTNTPQKPQAKPKQIKNNNTAKPKEKIK